MTTGTPKLPEDAPHKHKVNPQPPHACSGIIGQRLSMHTTLSLLMRQKSAMNATLSSLTGQRSAVHATLFSLTQDICKYNTNHSSKESSKR